VSNKSSINHIHMSQRKWHTRIGDESRMPKSAVNLFEYGNEVLGLGLRSYLSEIPSTHNVHGMCSMYLKNLSFGPIKYDAHRNTPPVSDIK
jgi:hypothetical protein